MGTDPTSAGFTAQDILRAKRALAIFHAEAGAYVSGNGVLPIDGSPALDEQAAFEEAESLRTVHSQATMLIEVAGDQLTAFLKTLEEPCETVAPWICIRGLLEACALSAWLVIPDIGVRERVSRSLALRYEGLDQQRKCVAAMGHSAFEVERRMDEIAQEAKCHGYKPIMGSRGRRIGLGTRMPSITELVRDYLGEEGMYRLLSAMAHGHFWAIHQLGFRLLTEDETPPPAAAVGTRAMEKAVNPAGVIYLALGAADAFGLAVWYQARYSGWELAALEASLHRLFDSMNVRAHRPAWLGAQPRDWTGSV